MSIDLRRYFRPAHILFSTSAASGLGFLTMLATSAWLPPNEYMLSFYWLTGANIAQSIAETCSIWATVKQRHVAEKLITSWGFWLVIPLTGILFVPRPLSAPGAAIGILMCFLLGLSFRCYLLRLIEFRRIRDYVGAQYTAAQAALLRFAFALAVIFAWRVPLLHERLFGYSGLVGPAAFLALGTSISYLFNGLRPYPRGTDPIAAMKDALPATGRHGELLATLALAVAILMSRSLVSSASHVLEEKWRPLLTIVSNTVMVTSGSLLSLLLDQSARRTLPRGRELFLIIALVGLALLIPDFRGGASGGLGAAIRIGCVTGGLVSATTFGLIFGSWYSSSVRCWVILIVMGTAYGLLLAKQSIGGVGPFCIGAALSSLTVGLGFFRLGGEGRFSWKFANVRG